MPYDAAKYAELCIASSYAPIKPQFLQDKDHFHPYLQAAYHPPHHQQDTAPPADQNGRTRGQNKKRRINTLVASKCKENQICSRLAAIGHCDFRNCKSLHHIKSRYNHLLQAKDAHKEPTTVIQEVLGAACPLYNSTGICPMGINCVINPLQHVNQEGLNVKRDASLVTDQDVKDQQLQILKNIPHKIIAAGKALNLSRSKHHHRQHSLPDQASPTHLLTTNCLLLDDQAENIPTQSAEIITTEPGNTDSGGAENTPECHDKAQGALPTTDTKSADDSNEEGKELSEEGKELSEEGKELSEGRKELSEGRKELSDTLLGDQSESLFESKSHLESAFTREKITPAEKRERMNSLLKGKVILAPLTTVGNLPFRRLCIKQGCEVTVSEMVLASGLCQFKPSDVALLKRHKDEKIFGVQIAGGFPDQCGNAAKIIEASVDCDWVDLNMGCPLDGLHGKGAGCVLMTRERKLEDIIKNMTSILTCPLTVKCRTAYMSKCGEMTIDSLFPKMYDWGASGFTLHGRTAKQRYLKTANWDQIAECRQVIPDDTLFIGNGDLFDPQGIAKVWKESQVDSVMIGRGALIKPWIFKEIKKGELIDISASERFDLLKDFCRFGLEHWGCDSRGVETTRRFLLEHLSFACRYIPVGLLEVLPQRHNWRPRSYLGRNDLETLMSKPDSGSWIKLSEMLLGPVPDGFSFVPKHKSSAYEEK